MKKSTLSDSNLEDISYISDIPEEENDASKDPKAGETNITVAVR